MIKATSNDLVGLICDNHMSFADKSFFKAKDPFCIQLSKFFNQEIDAPKNGNFIDIETLKEEGLLMKKRPDFLSNGMCCKKKTYESPGILGKLYRKIDKKKIYNNFRINFFEKAIRRNYSINNNLITKNCFKYLCNAYSIYDNYKKKICNLMRKYNFCTESELFLNLRVFKNNRGYRGKADSYNIELKNIMEYISNLIMNKFKIINEDVSSAIYIVASYINLKSVYEKQVYFSNDYEENFAKLMSIFEKEKNDFQELFKDYNDYASIKQKKKRGK